MDSDGVNQVGKLAKNWSGFLREAYTNADNFTLTCEHLNHFI
jgi:hypothetical protein